MSRFIIFEPLTLYSESPDCRFIDCIQIWLDIWHFSLAEKSKEGLCLFTFTPLTDRWWKLSPARTPTLTSLFVAMHEELPTWWKTTVIWMLSIKQHVRELFIKKHPGLHSIPACKVHTSKLVRNSLTFESEYRLIEWEYLSHVLTFSRFRFRVMRLIWRLKWKFWFQYFIAAASGGLEKFWFILKFSHSDFLSSK